MNTKEKYRFISAPYIIDRKLYKYYSNTKYAVDCIRNRRIHLDDPRSFNDPFDAALHCAKISTLALNDSELILAKKFFNFAKMSHILYISEKFLKNACILISFLL